MKTQEELQTYVASVSDICPDWEEYAPLKSAMWIADDLSVELMHQCFSQTEAVEWITREISMAHEDGRSHGQTYVDMLANGSDYPVVVTLDQNNKLIVVDGWHRIAIGVVRNEPIKSVIGRWM